VAQSAQRVCDVRHAPIGAGDLHDPRLRPDELSSHLRVRLR
jgi:hypothetical protein